MKKKHASSAGTAVPPLKSLRVFLLAAPFAAGLFYEPLAALSAVFLAGWLVVYARRTRSLRLAKSPMLLGTSVLVLFFILSIPWAVDRGMALLGAVKFLPLPLYAAVCGLLTQEQRDRLVGDLPLGGAAMTLLSLAALLVPGLSERVLVSGRLGGFFLYPNTFGLYALLGFGVLAMRKEWDRKAWTCYPLLLLGVILSGSRTVAVLLIAAVTVCCLLADNGKRRILLIASTAMVLAAVFVAGRLGLSSSARLVTGAAGGSTFFGRLLYFRDALPVILRHPLGLGYMGYYFRQGSFQTGVYTVMHVHNDLLQILLDVGWIPAALLCWGIVRAFLRADRIRRLVIGLLCFHSLFDFDLQFTAMGLILLTAAEGEEKPLPSFKRPAVTGLCGILSALCLYLGIASCLYYLNMPRAATAVYPGYTMAWIDRMTLAEDGDTMEEAADHTLALNRWVSLADSAKARACFARGDVQSMILYEERAIALAKYDRDSYLDYLDMLLAGIDLYRSAGDADSAEYCRQRALAVPERMEAVTAGTSALGRRITDLPDMTLPEPYRLALDGLTG